MRHARGHFEDIDLILATHAHRDHFHAPFVMDHLSKNKKGTFISCEQSIHQITGSDAYNPAIQSQLVEVTPDSLSFIDTVVNGIEMRVFRLNHGPYYEEDPETGEKINRHRNVQNLGFLFHLDGIKIFHGGDSSPAWKSDFEHFRLDKENIDIAFLGRAFIWNGEPERMELLRNHINPSHIVLMHIHHDHNERFIEMAEKIKDAFPSIQVFEERMESKIYTIE